MPLRCPRFRFSVSSKARHFLELTICVAGLTALNGAHAAETATLSTVLGRLGFETVKLRPAKDFNSSPEVPVKIGNKVLTAHLGWDVSLTILDKRFEKLAASSQEAVAVAPGGLPDGITLATVPQLKLGSYEAESNLPVLLANLSHRRCDVVLSSQLLRRHSAIYIPGRDELLLKATAFDERQAGDFSKMMVRSGFSELHLSSLKLGDRNVTVADGELNDRPVCFQINLNEISSLLSLPAAEGLGLKPRNYKAPATTLSRIPNNMELRLVGDDKSKDETLKEAKVQRLRFGECAADGRYFFLSKNLYGDAQVSRPERPLVGFLGLDLLCQAGAVLDYRGERLYLLNGPTKRD